MITAPMDFWDGKPVDPREDAYRLARAASVPSVRSVPSVLNSARKPPETSYARMIRGQLAERASRLQQQQRAA